VAGTLKVVEFVRALKIPRLVYAASSSCYGIAEDYPTSEKSRIQLEYPYALTKYMGEEIILHWSKVYGFSATSLRLFNVFGLRSRTSGSYGAVIGVFLAQKLADKPLTIVGDGSQSRDFTHVSDVVNAFVSSLEVETSENTRIYNVGSGRTQTVSYLAKLIGGPTVPLPKRPGEPDITFADITKIKAELGWNPNQKFEDGVLELLENIDQFKDAPVWDVKSIERATDVWFKRLSKES
jgi:UDP-glucose 4-epimerase